MSNKAKPAGKPKKAPPAPKRRLPMAAIVFVGIALVLIIVLAFAGGTSGEAAELGEPTVTGEPLPLYPGDTATDPAVGMIMPEIVGQDFSGETVTIRADGAPKAIAVFAHWCPNCQAEVPEIQAWIDAGGVPQGVALYSVSTSVGSTRPNYPPSAWFVREGWTVPVVKDNGQQIVGEALGVSGYPFWLFVDGDGTVVARTAGAIDIPVVQGLLELMAPVG